MDQLVQHAYGTDLASLNAGADAYFDQINEHSSHIADNEPHREQLNIADEAGHHQQPPHQAAPDLEHDDETKALFELYIRADPPSPETIYDYSPVSYETCITDFEAQACGFIQNLECNQQHGRPIVYDLCQPHDLQILYSSLDKDIQHLHFGTERIEEPSAEQDDVPQEEASAAEDHRPFQPRRFFGQHPDDFRFYKSGPCP